MNRKRNNDSGTMEGKTAELRKHIQKVKTRNPHSAHSTLCKHSKVKPDISGFFHRQPLK